MAAAKLYRPCDQTLYLLSCLIIIFDCIIMFVKEMVIKYV